MRRTPAALHNFLENDKTAIRVEVDQVHGSTPRNQGTWMLVSGAQIFGTIGGGELENIAIKHAREMLTTEIDIPTDMQIPLGPHIGQCCGGVVNLKFEILDEAQHRTCEQIFTTEISLQPDIYIFGAGHVGKALADALSLLPVNAILIDNREEELAPVSDYIQTHLTALPEAMVRNAKANSVFIIMTHDHSLDFLIAKDALNRNDAAYVGMIGSKTKRATFKNWLKREQDSEANFNKLICPIGNADIGDKRPEIIAALAVAEIIEHIHKTELMTSNNKVENSQLQV